MRVLFIVLVLSVLSFPSGATTTEGRLRLATWNIGNLYHRDGIALRPGAQAREAADFAALRAYAKALDADVIALQEINSPEAANRIFPRAVYDVVVDGRRAKDLADGRRPPAEGGEGAFETDGIYTAFAFRRGAVEIVEIADVPALGVVHGEREGVPRRTRWGLSVLLRVGGKTLRLLNVHLKSACHTGRLRTSSRRDDCVTLARQVPILEAWIDRHALTTPVIVLGDMNRKIERYREDDDLWREIDDGTPSDLDRLPERPAKQPYRDWLDKSWKGCPTFHGKDYGPIDYFFYDEKAAAFVVPASYRHVRYKPEDVEEHGEGLSDHCPATLDLEFD